MQARIVFTSTFLINQVLHDSKASQSIVDLIESQGLVNIQALPAVGNYIDIQGFVKDQESLSDDMVDTLSNLDHFIVNRVVFISPDLIEIQL